MILTFTIILTSWLLNAAMDAIDHGKGAGTLGILWHELKWLSYALPFGYIMYLTRPHLGAIVGLVLIAWLLWEALYHYLRYINFHTWD